MAREYGVPFYALVQNPGKLVSGKDLEIEERSGAELLEFQGRQLVGEPFETLAARYPAFDITPGSLITRFVGFEDLFSLEQFREKYLKGVENSPGHNALTTYLLVFGVPRKENYDFLIHAVRAEQADRLLIPEMRPGLYGARFVARELLKRNAPVTLVSDNMLGALFANGEIRKVYLSYSELGEAGPRGICGSLLVAQLARLHGISVDLQASADEIPSGMDRDVTTFLGERVLPAGAEVYPVEDEVIPWSLLRARQTEGR
jgi:methylthioribose-1-phosphate isomerase